MAEGPKFKTTMNFAYGVPRELAPGVIRLVANNPGHFTFKGTNTYIVGSGEDLALIEARARFAATIHKMLNSPPVHGEDKKRPRRSGAQVGGRMGSGSTAGEPARSRTPSQGR